VPVNSVSGTVLREWRRSRGWDASDMSVQIRHAAMNAHIPAHGSLKRMIWRWERVGLSTERYQLLYARALGIPPDDLAEGPFPSPVTSLSLMADREDGDEPVNHREPGAAAMEPFAPEIISVLGRALQAPARETAPVRALSEVQRDVVRAWRLRQSAKYDELGPLTAGLLRDTVAHLEAARGQEDLPEQAGAAVHAHNTASSLLKRLGAFELAAIAADRGLRIARESGDGLLAGAAVLRLSNVFLSASRYAEAMETAARGAENLPARASAPAAEIATFGALLLTAAVAAAKLGASARAWEFLGDAKSAARIMTGEHAGLFAVFGPVNLAIHGVQVATELGDSREALSRAELVDVRGLPAALLERRSTLMIDIARSQTRQGDQHAAGETLIEAERLAPLEVRYNRDAHRLLGELLSSGRVSTGLREMAERAGAAA
jgi:tetratricopeptide (TPR) repeat protein